MPQAVSQFTAAQFARVLGITKRGILHALRGTAAIPLPGRGGVAKGWPISTLPESWQRQIDKAWRAGGFRDAAHMLNAAVKPWQPLNRDGKPVPLSQIAPHWLTRATSLRDAVALPLARQHEITRTELRELGLNEYARAVGHPISAKQ